MQERCILSVHMAVGSSLDMLPQSVERKEKEKQRKGNFWRNS